MSSSKGYFFGGGEGEIDDGRLVGNELSYPLIPKTRDGTPMMIRREAEKKWFSLPRLQRGLKGCKAISSTFLGV